MTAVWLASYYIPTSKQERAMGGNNELNNKTRAIAIPTTGKNSIVTQTALLEISRFSFFINSSPIDQYTNRYCLFIPNDT